MTSKTLKSFAILAMIPLMLSGFNGQAFAQQNPQSYDENIVEEALIEMDPYVTIDEKKFAKIQMKQAKDNGISQEKINIAKDYVKMINKMAKDHQDDSKKKIKISDEDKSKFGKFFDKIKNQGGSKAKIVKTGTFLDYILPYAYAIPCNVWGPHNQPSTTYSGEYATRSAAVSSLSSGYNLVPDYASHNDGDDYADWVSAYFCANGVFRIQSIVYENTSSNWQFSQHHWPSEPNPEVFGYGWPAFWWGPYALAWHGF